VVSVSDFVVPDCFLTYLPCRQFTRKNCGEKKGAEKSGGKNKRLFYFVNQLQLLHFTSLFCGRTQIIDLMPTNKLGLLIIELK
jgi:hypothetical protein